MDSRRALLILALVALVACASAATCKNYDGRQAGARCSAGETCCESSRSPLPVPCLLRHGSQCSCVSVQVSLPDGGIPVFTPSAAGASGLWCDMGRWVTRLCPHKQAVYYCLGHTKTMLCPVCAPLQVLPARCG